MSKNFPKPGKDRLLGVGTSIPKSDTYKSEFNIKEQEDTEEKEIPENTNTDSSEDSLFDSPENYVDDKETDKKFVKAGIKQVIIDVGD